MILNDQQLNALQAASVLKPHTHVDLLDTIDDLKRQLGERYAVPKDAQMFASKIAIEAESKANLLPSQAVQVARIIGKALDAYVQEQVDEAVRNATAKCIDCGRPQHQGNEICPARDEFYG